MSTKKWLKLVCLALSVLLLVTGCSAFKGSDKTIDKLENDTKLEEKIQAEKGIESVMVQVVEGKQDAVNVDIVINDEQELTPDQVIEKYYEIIKKEYPKKAIDILVAKDGKLLQQKNFKK